MASRDLKDLNFILADAYTKAKDKYGKMFPSDSQPFITCTYRSNLEQETLYKQPADGLDNNGNGIIDDASEKVTQARGGESPHNYLPSCAFDIAFISLKQKLDWNSELFKRFADIVKEIEPRIEWGGAWKFRDVPHFQLFGWKNFIPTKR